MPLQFRRDTTANITQFDPVLKQGEPLWDIDEKKLYIGDGENPATNLDSITGVTESEVGDVIAQIIDNGTSPNINFVYDSGDLALNVSLDFTTPLNSEIRSIAGFVGSLIGDDSVTVFESSESAFVNLQEAFLTDIGPRTDNTFDVGSATKRFKEGFFHNINVIDQTVVEDIVVNGLIKTEDSSILFDSRTSTLSADSIIGDLYGSVFGSDSVILVDFNERIFYGTVDTGDAILSQTGIIVANSNFFEIGSRTSPLSLDLNLETNLQIQQIVDEVNSTGFITTTMSRGSHDLPQAIQPGDDLGGLVFRGYTDNSTLGFAGIISFFVDPTATISGGEFVKSQMAIVASSDTGQEEENAFVLDSEGVASSNAFVATKYMQLPVYENDTARLAEIPTPAKGMMIFMESGTTPSATNQMQVFNGTAWINAS